MDKIQTEINQNTIKELYKKAKVNYLLFIIISIVLALGFVFILIVVEDKASRIVSIIALVFSGILFELGLYNYIVAIRNEGKFKNRKLIYDISFNKDRIVVGIYENDEKLEEAYYNYDLFKKYTLTSNYVIAHYKGGGIIPFDRSEKIIKLLEEKGIKRNKK